jgi:signal transduction histidine kinase
VRGPRRISAEPWPRNGYISNPQVPKYTTVDVIEKSVQAHAARRLGNPVVAPSDGHEVERFDALIEGEPFWSSFGRVRRRPPVYAASAVVVAVAALSWSEPRAWWIAVGLALMAAAAIFRKPAPETVITYSSDLVALAAGIAFIGLDPFAGMALWSAIVVVAFFGLPRLQARFVVAATVAAVALTLVADGRWAIVDLSNGGRLAVSIALTVIGFTYLVTAIPSLAEATRTVLRVADESTEVQRRQAEFRAQLASMVAHELRNPLAGIRGFVDVLASERDQLTPSERDEYLAIVASQTASLEGIVEDLLVAVQEEHDRVSVDEKRFDASELVTRVVTELGPGASEAIEVDVTPDVIALGDPPRVAQIVRNLLSNARKYGGPNVTISCDVTAGGVRIAVVDDGDGIPPEDVARVFQRFEGTARGSGGYGLGLPISRQLAQAMAGDLTYEPGEGATFVLTLRTA